jgi:hypothetical protein
MADCKLRWSSVADCSKVHLLTFSLPRPRVSDCAQTAPGCSARQMAHVSMSHLWRKRQGGFWQTGVILADAGHGAYPPRFPVMPLRALQRLAEPVGLI